VGPDRQGVPIRDRRRERLAGRPVQGPLAASRIPLHVRPRLHGWVPVLLRDRRRLDGFVIHLANHDVAFSAVSRAPLAKLQAYKRRMAWSFPWASSFGTDFNHDFHAAYTEGEQQSGVVEYNYRAVDVRESLEAGKEGPLAEFAAGAGTDWATFTREAPGMSAFVLEDGVVYHTYSAYARGLDGLWSMYQWLDRAPHGRNETDIWWRRHDEYDTE
jgi:predicted dithiol-disulfide oxidoreductase (DUF899 family)